jgi:uncharacterized protein (TIGR02996 family)
MSELTNLMKAVVGNPADDLPRLVFADWFDENGQPERAEFVRVQIELEQRAAYCPSHFVPGHLKACEPCSARRRLENRERKLFRTHGRGWFVELPGTLKGMAWGHKSTRLSHLDTSNGVTFGFRRGFVSEVRCNLTKWIGGCVACRPPSAERLHPKQPCPSCGGRTTECTCTGPQERGCGCESGRAKRRMNRNSNNSRTRCGTCCQRPEGWVTDGGEGQSQSGQTNSCPPP